MRIVFMGTPDFATHALKALREAGHEIAAVYSQPPRPAGRGYDRDALARACAGRKPGASRSARRCP
jgi:methionyl-tRNA formyltransferase